jgi:hypothetical protein
MLQHTIIFQMILCFQLCDSSLEKALSCFSMTLPPCTKQGPYKNDLSRLVWKNWTGLHRALTSIPSNIFGMNWNADCEPGLIAQHPCRTSLMLMAEWKQVPTSMFQHLVESLPRRVETVIAEKREPTLY